MNDNDIVVVGMFPQKNKIRITCSVAVLPQIELLDGVEYVEKLRTFVRVYAWLYDVHIGATENIDDVRARLEGLNREHA